jgi:hypothetical protein
MPETFSIPEEPQDVKRVVTTNGTGRLFTRNSGRWDDTWIDEDGTEYDWVELLQEFGEVREVVAPAEAVEFFKKYGTDLKILWENAPGTPYQEHFRTLVEFAEALS